MIKHWLPAVILSLTASQATSQTLFTFGTHKASADEFLKAFNKNNQQTGVTRKQAMKEYLDLYINSKLKIQQAYDLGYDTLETIKADAQNLRNQIVDNYMSDPEAITRLGKEAFQRSLKDIHAAHIFIAYTNPAGTGPSGDEKLKLAEKRLAAGEDFLSVAHSLSDDPSAKTNKGDLNWITVFTLPYELETLLYNTPVGRYSKVYKSKAGYHIFKNIAERKAIGRMKVQQILLAFPPGLSADEEKKITRLADSLYQRITKGDDFGKLAAAFSNDHISAARDGITPEIGVGEYDPEFEKIVWSLSKDGAYTKPFKTSHGIHIVKRLAHIPIVTNAADKENNERLEAKVRADDRWKTIRDFIYVRVKNKPGVQQAFKDENLLWAMTDSVLSGSPMTTERLQQSVLTIGESIYRLSDWIQYVQMYRYLPGKAGIRPYSSLMEDFANNAMYKYYRDHLEDYNEEFRMQMAEFREGNLFFEVMQREVWNRAQTDTAELQAFYEKHKSQYVWQPSADAIIFFSSDQQTAKKLAEEITRDPNNWRQLAEKYSENTVADSSRYEWTQLPGILKSAPKPGTVTAMSVNQAENSASFAYIIKVYPEPGSRSFNEAKGLVMNDYQALLEERWIENLRKIYPVKIDEKVFAEIASK